jgi:hypothetical protein
MFVIFIKGINIKIKHFQNFGVLGFWGFGVLEQLEGQLP